MYVYVSGLRYACMSAGALGDQKRTLVPMSLSCRWLGNSQPLSSLSIPAD